MGVSDVENARWVPEVDMQFGNEDEAYGFYNKYAGILGFSVRKSKMWMTSKDVLAARTFVCSKQGFRQKKKGFEPKKPRPATRTGCPACMTIKITPTGRYRVTEFVPGHNHLLANPSTSHMLRSHRQKIKEKIVEASSVKDLKMVENPAHNICFKNAMMKGDVGAVLEYLQKMQLDNPSFYYAISTDENDCMTNFFWADAKSVMDYMAFGDVVSFDTTYKTTEYGRPLVLFVGVNNHRQAIIFGSALLYDDRIESFIWLFKTFKNAMRGLQPKTMLTDRSEEISNAVAVAWPGTAHRLCVWHIFQNASKQLSQVFEGSKTFACEFAQCVFDFEEEEDFVSAWESLIEKYDLQDNEWLNMQFQDRERWALPYGRDVFCADMISILKKENLNNAVNKCLSPKLDMLQFLEHYDRVLDERRSAEMQADFNACQSIKRAPTFRMLKQAVNAYTPAIFKVFEKEFELHMDCMVYSSGGQGTTSNYKVTVEEKPKEHIVRFESLNNTILCSCRKFEFAGIQCRHVFKVLDFRNIKELPSQYILKRWRKDAKIDSIKFSSACASENDPKLSPANRHSYLCCILGTIAARAARTTESSDFVKNQSIVLSEQVEQLLHTRNFHIQTLDDNLQHDGNTEASFGVATNGILGF